MKFKIEQEVFEKFPDLIVGMPVILGFDNTKSPAEALEFLRQTEIEVREKMTLESLWKDPRVIAYLDCFKDFGVDPNKFLPAHVALTKRVLEGGQLPDINPMVNLYNTMSIKFLTPFGGENLSSVYGDFVLKIAQGGEQWIAIGAEKNKPAAVGELIWADDFDVSTRALNWRQCDRTKMTTETVNGYFIMDGFASVNRENIAKAAEEFISVATKLFGGKASLVWMDKENPEVEIDFESKVVLEGDLEKAKNKKSKEILDSARMTNEVKKESNFSRQKGSISWQLAELIASAVNAQFEGLNFNSEAVYLEHPAVEEHGDYSSAIALELKDKIENVKNPREIAEKIASEINKDNKVNKLVEKVEVAGPGFINFWLAKDYLIGGIGQIRDLRGRYGEGKMHEGKKVILEFTDPNPFKEFHIGHVYTNTVGESLARLFKSQGARVWRVNYEGDVGLHVAKAMWGILKMMEGLPKDSDSPSVKAHFLGQAYALGSNKYEEDESVKAEINDLNKKIYAKDPSIWELYEKGKKWSLEYFETLYQILGTKFDHYYFESEVGMVGLDLVKAHIADGIFEESKGAVIFPGEKSGLHNRVFVNSLGLPTYEAKEIGLAPTKFRDFKYDLSLIITGNEINEYFKVLLKALSLIYPDLASKTIHLGHGMVRLPAGKMSSRTGKVITGEWLIDEVKRLAFEKITKKVKVVSLEADFDKSDTVQKVAIGAIKYAFLKSAIGGDIEFDMGKSVDFEGDSGPYLQYTYARARSVLRKAETENTNFKFQISNLKNEELEILRWIYRFPEVVEQAAKTYSPNLIASFIFELSKRFNNFYNNQTIIGSHNEKFRLHLTEACSIVLKNALNLLGIQVLERM